MLRLNYRRLIASLYECLGACLCTHVCRNPAGSRGCDSSFNSFISPVRTLHKSPDSVSSVLYPPPHIKRKQTHSLTLFFFLNEGRPYCIITFNAALISTVAGCFQGSAFFPEVSLLQRARSTDLASHRRLSLEFLFQTRRRSAKALCKVIFLYAALGNLL